MFGSTSAVSFIFILAAMQVSMIVYAMQVSMIVYGFDDARTKEECTAVLLSLVTPKGKLTCDEMFDWSMCVARVLGFDTKDPSNDNLYIFKDYLEEILKLVSLDCTININDVIEVFRPRTTIQKPVDPMNMSTTEQLMYSTSTTSTLFPGKKGCLQYSKDACYGRPDGNYPVCLPVCQGGHYIVCANWITEMMTCPVGWYQLKNKTPPEGRFTAPLIYNSFWDMCLEASADCPRDSDSLIEDKK